MSDKILKYGVVGAGSIAEQKHLKGYSKVDGIEIAAICDENIDKAKTLAQRYGIPKVYSDYNSMFDDMKLDIISICTPNYSHVPIAVAALEKGINVHCEKPAALNAALAQKIADAKDKSGRKVMIALNNRFTNNSYFMKSFIDSKSMGDIYHIRCGWRRRRGIPGRGSWFTNKALSGGGPLIDLGVHFIDLLLYLIGNMDAETVSGQSYSKFSNNDSRNNWSYGSSGQGICNVEDMAVGFVKLKGGITLDFEFSWASNIEKDMKFYEIYGTKAGASFKDDKITIFSEIEGTNIDIYPNTNYSKEAVNEFQHFADCIRKDIEPMAKIEEAVKIMKIIDAVYLSSELGREVIVY